MSCSSQAPKSAMPGDATIVSLSRPFFASTPNTVPKITPGLLSAGTQEAQACSISSARSRNFLTSTPITAAGTIPKSESAE